MVRRLPLVVRGAFEGAGGALEKSGEDSSRKAHY